MDASEMGPPLQIAQQLGKNIPYPIRAFVPTLSVPLPLEAEERLAVSLALAVNKIMWSIRQFPRVRVLFGSPPYYVTGTGTGLEVYVADMSQDPVGTTVGDAVYLDALRLAAMPIVPFDVAAVALLEELVHAWMNVLDEGIAKDVTARLFGGIRVANEQYLPL